MSRNINRAELISKVKELDGLSNDEKSALLELLNEKKIYGLVWENHVEEVEEQLRENLPVFREVPERRILSDEADAPNHTIIEADNLHALVALTYTHAGKIDVIYIDPPYNTGNKDFIYNDSYVDSEDSYRHSKWLSFMEKRLKIAKALLSDKGVVFISIDDNEHANLKILCDDIFGYDNYEATITYVRKTSGKQDSSNFVKSTEYILVYSKSKQWVASSLIAEEKVTGRYNKIDDSGRKYRETDLRKTGNADRRIDRPFMFYPFYYNPESKELRVSKEIDNSLRASGFVEVLPIKPDGEEGRWRWAYSSSELSLSNLVAKEMPKYPGKYTIYEKDYIDKKEDIRTVKEHTAWDRKEFNSDNAIADFKALGFGNQDFPYPKSTELVKHIIYLSNNKESIILDFFAGSGTTMHATMQLNAEDGGKRQCILVTNNENGICENVTYERNKRVIQGYTTPKGEQVAGLSQNNLRYYKADFVSREPNNKNKRELVKAATDLLCIKEGLYDESKITCNGKTLRKDYARRFADGEKEMLIIYEPAVIKYIVEEIKSWNDKEFIKIYVFSEGRYAFDDDFKAVIEKVTLCALPDAIYQAYKNVLPRRKRAQQLDAPVDETELAEALKEAEEGGEA